MFSDCNTLIALNAARIKACNEPGADIISINNAYNECRMRILRNTTRMYKKLFSKPIVVEAGRKYCALPIAGSSDRLGVIQLKEDGFYL